MSHTSGRWWQRCACQGFRRQVVQATPCLLIYKTLRNRLQPLWAFLAVQEGPLEVAVSPTSTEISTGPPPIPLLGTTTAAAPTSSFGKAAGLSQQGAGHAPRLQRSALTSSFGNAARLSQQGTGHASRLSDSRPKLASAPRCARLPSSRYSASPPGASASPPGASSASTSRVG